MVAPVTAMNAYKTAGKLAMQDHSANPTGAFANMVKESLQDAVQQGYQAEHMNMKALAGKADLNDVVTAVSSAEVTLQTITAIRDRLVQAYQEISRMPI